jgi:hypothetical protein
MLPANEKDKQNYIFCHSAFINAFQRIMENSKNNGKVAHKIINDISRHLG